MDSLLLAKYEMGAHTSESLISKLQSLKLVVFDVDGVLTDGRLFYGEQGESIKCFNVKDGVALKLLPKWGVDVAVITAKDSAPLRQRMQDLGVKHFYPGSHDKKAAFSDLLGRLFIEASEAAYVGDDVIDLQVMPLVGLSFCPSDAHELVQRHCSQVLLKKGGEGIAREVCDLVLASRMRLEDAYELAAKPEFESNQL